MSLSDLPTELLVDVFKAVDTISSAAALSQTSHHLHATWRSNLPSICDAVLPRMIEAYDQARQFLELREISNLATGHSSVEDKANAAVLRAASLLVNADTARLKFKEFEVGTHDQWGGWASTKAKKRQQKDRTLDQSSRICFLKGYYRANSVVHLIENDRTELLKPTLASIHLLDFLGAYEVIKWDFAEHGQNFAGWSVFHLLFTDLRQVPGMRPLIDKLASDSNQYHLILHDVCIRETAERAKGIALANFLPLLPKDSCIEPSNMRFFRENISRVDQASATRG